MFLGALPVSAGLLSGTFVPLPGGTNVNLTTVGTLDWVHWGLNSATNVNRKISVAPQIGPLTTVGDDPIQQLATNQAGLSWTDGTPLPAVTNARAGISIQGLTNGFEISVAADTQRRRLRIFAGVEAAAGLFEASLSDASAPGYYDESLASTTSLSNGVFILDFAADALGQTLTVRFTTQTLFDAAAGRVLLQATALASNVPPTVRLVSPTNNAAFPNSAAITLTAEASDSDGGIQLVEFYQGATKLGEALESPHTFQWDNPQAGDYSLTARAFDQEGASTVSAPVAITVQNNFAPTVTLTNPVNYSSFSLPATITLEALASDIDGTVAKVEFFANATNKIGEATQSPYVVLWTNATVGEYPLTARATDNKGVATVSSAVDVFLTGTGGLLTAAGATVTDTIQLDTEGPSDWAHWGLLTEQSFNHKRGVTPQISNYFTLTKEPAWAYADNANGYSWVDGTPTPAATNTPTGVYCAGPNNGFGLQVPAGPTPRTLKLYVGAWGARGRLLAYLSDFSAPVVSDVSVDNASGGPSTVYTLQYASAAAGHYLLIRYFVDAKYNQYGNVTLQAAALDTGNRPPLVALTNPPDGTDLQWPANIVISADANDSDGWVTNVQFFGDAVLLGQRTNPPYTLVWSNVAAGSHALTAAGTDDGGVTFTSQVANVFVSAGGGLLGGSETFPPSSVDLSAEGQADWGHWGLARATSFDHRKSAMTRISDWTRIGGGVAEVYSNNFTSFSWTNGTPTLVVAATKTGIYRQGLGNGFQISAPADPTRRQLRVYVGLYGARARFEASLSDNSARPFVDTSLVSAGNHYRVYTIDYAAATPGKQLIVRHTCEELFDTLYGNVTLQAATLTDLPLPRLLDAKWNGRDFSFRLPTQTNKSYLILYADQVQTNAWQPWQSFPGTGGDVWITNFTPLPPQRFYRAMEY